MSPPQPSKTPGKAAPPPPEGGGGGEEDSPESKKSCSSKASSDDPPPPPLPPSFAKDMKLKSSSIESNLAYKYSLMGNAPTATTTTTTTTASTNATATTALDPNDPMMKYRGLLVSLTLNPENANGLAAAEGMVRQQMAEDGVNALEIDLFFDPSISLRMSSPGPQTTANLGAANNGSLMSTPSSSNSSSSSLLARISRRISSISLFNSKSNYKLGNNVEDVSTDTAGKDENKAPPPPSRLPPPPPPPPASIISSNSSITSNTLIVAASDSRDDNDKSLSLLKRMSRAISKAVGSGSSKNKMAELTGERSNGDAIKNHKGDEEPPTPQIATTNTFTTDENPKKSSKTGGSRPITYKNKGSKQDIPEKKHINNTSSPSPSLGSLEDDDEPPPSFNSDASISDEDSIASQVSQARVVVGGRRYSMVNRSRTLSRNSVLLNNNTALTTSINNNNRIQNSRSNSQAHSSNLEGKQQGGIMRDDNNNSPKVHRNRMNVTFGECAIPSSSPVMPSGGGGKGGGGGEARNNKGGNARIGNTINNKSNDGKGGASAINIDAYNTKFFLEKNKKESEGTQGGALLEAEIRSLFGVYSKNMRHEYDPNILAMMVSKRKLEVSLGYSLDDESLAVVVNNEMNRTSVRAVTPTRGSAIQEVYDQLVPLEVSASKSFHNNYTTNQYFKKDVANSSVGANLFQMDPEEEEEEEETPKKASPEQKHNYFNPSPNPNFDYLSPSKSSFSDDMAVPTVLLESNPANAGNSKSKISNSSNYSNNSSLYSPYKLNQDIAVYKHSTRAFKHIDLSTESKAIRAMSPTENSMRRIASSDASFNRNRYVQLLEEETDMPQKGREVMTAQEKVWMMAAQRSIEKPREGVKGDVAIIQGAFGDAKRMLREFDSLAHKETWEALS